MGSVAGVGGFASFQPIGDEGLMGTAWGNYVRVKGPCGDGHTMSMRAARQLRNWLHDLLINAEQDWQQSLRKQERLADISERLSREEAAAIADAAMCGG